jgi:hypothetical protein
MHSPESKYTTHLRSLFQALPALTLITAAIAKTGDPFAFLYELADYEFSLPIDLEAALGLLLPGIEAFLGLWLLFKRSHAAILSCIAVFIMFTLGIIFGLPEGYLQTCGCLGAEDLRPGYAIGKNIILLGFLLWSLRVKSEHEKARNPWGAVALVAGGVFTANLVFFLLWGIAALLALRDQLKHAAAFLVGFAIGLYLNWMYLPVILLPFLGALFYLPRFETSKRSMVPVLVLGCGILICTYLALFPLGTDSRVVDLSTPTVITEVPADGLVIWVTGGLQGQWEPIKDENDREHGGMLRIARALELYREKGDLLIDVGDFRYPEDADPASDTVQILSDGYLKALARLDYSAISVTERDIEPDPKTLAQTGEQYGLPLIYRDNSEDHSFVPMRAVQVSKDCLVQIHSSEKSLNSEKSRKEDTFRILLITSTEVDNMIERLNEFDLILWKNEGHPVVQIHQGGILLGVGDEGFLGRIEFGGDGFSAGEIDLSSWLDGNWTLHHPARERIRVGWQFWKKKPGLSAYLWAVPEALSPHLKTRTQMEQTMRELEGVTLDH